MSLFSQYFGSVCEPFSREQILHSLHIFLLLLSTNCNNVLTSQRHFLYFSKEATSWRQTMTLHLAHVLRTESWRNLGTQSIYPFAFPNKMYGFWLSVHPFKHWNLYVVDWVVAWVEMHCYWFIPAKYDVSKMLLYSFFQLPSGLANIHHFVTLYARESIHDIPLREHRCRSSLCTTGLTICFAGLSWSRHVSLKFVMNQYICQVAISSVGCH